MFSASNNIDYLDKHIRKCIGCKEQKFISTFRPEYIILLSTFNPVYI